MNSTTCEVEAKFKELNAGKSGGPDNLQPNILRELTRDITGLGAYMFLIYQVWINTGWPKNNKFSIYIYKAVGEWSGQLQVN